MTDIRTPIEDAKKNFRRLRRDPGYRNLSGNQLREYFMYRGLRAHTRHWRRVQGPALMERVPEAREEANAWIEQRDAFSEWFKGQAPTDEKFIEEHGPSVEPTVDPEHG